MSKLAQEVAYGSKAVGKVAPVSPKGYKAGGAVGDSMSKSSGKDKAMSNKSTGKNKGC